MPAGPVVGDARYALRVSEADGTLARHPAYIGVDIQPAASGEVVTAELDVLNFAFAGYLRPLEDAALEISPLVRSSADAGFLDPNMLAFTPDINSLHCSYLCIWQLFCLSPTKTGLPRLHSIISYIATLYSR